MIDLVVVGGGILGAATAFQYAKHHPGRSVLVLEKELQPASHQSGHNSGVLHSGLMYKPGSSKARLCRLGKQLMEEFCRRSGIPFETCGKLIVATRDVDLERLDVLHQRAIANGVEVSRVKAADLSKIEPAAAGLAGLHVPGTGIVDYGRVTASLIEQVQELGGEFRCGTHVRRIQTEGDRARVQLFGSDRDLLANRVITCSGLQADRLAQRSDASPEIRIAPFLGEYYALKSEYRDQVRGMIYPVADPRFPFLGVHLTKRIDGGVDCGPNALPTLAREGYSKWALNPRDAASLISWPGSWRLFARYFPIAAIEIRRSLSRRVFAEDLARLLPALRADWLEPGPSGVRAQALDKKGLLNDDFLIKRSARCTHLLNAPSPAATSSLALSREILRKSEI